MFIGFGAFFAGFGTQYTIGTAARMGPGYFPTVLGILLMVLGLVVSITGLSSKANEERIDRFDWRTLLIILGSVVLFGILLPRAGLVLSLLTLVLVSAFASHEFKLKEAIINAAVLIILSLVVFVWALSLQFQLWPAFISG
jgi:hypothetical protein